MRFQEISERCWTGYRQAGMKKKGDRTVPNCVPVEENAADQNTAASLARDLKAMIADYEEIKTAGLDSSNIGYIRKLKRGIQTTHEQIRNLGYRYDADQPTLIRLMGRPLGEVKIGPEMTANELLYAAAARAMRDASREGISLDYEQAIKQASKIYGIPYQPSELPKLLAQRAEIDRQLALLKQGKQVAKQRRLAKLAPTPAGAEEWFKTHSPTADRIKPPTQTLEAIEEDLRKWFKEKWVRFGPDGKIRGDCARGSSSEGKPKCLPQSKAHALGKKGRASAAAKKRREDPNPERRGPAKNVATKVKEAQTDYQKRRQRERDIDMGRPVKPLPKNTKTDYQKRREQERRDMELGENQLDEKQDACYRKVKSRYKVWPSAYASGALVQCRKKGAANWGNKGKKK